MDQSKIVAFNSLFFELCSFLQKTFKDEESLKNYEVKLNLLNKINPLLIYSSFKEYALPYQKHIIDCDESFFLQEINRLFKDTDEFLDFNKLWHKKENTLEVKARIFQYFRKLLKLCV